MSFEEEFLRWRPINPGDPGPEVYRIFEQLPGERQRELTAVITNAVGKIAQIKGEAYTQIGKIVGQSGKG